jgi:hypothetical protein
MAGPFDPAASGALLPMVPAAPNTAESGMGLSQLGAGVAPFAMPTSPGGDPFERQVRAQAGASSPLTQSYSFTEDEVNDLARQQGTDPSVMRQLLEQQGAQVQPGMRTLTAKPLVQPQEDFEQQVRADLAAAPPQKRQRAPQAAPGQAAGGAGGFRKLLNTELQKRMAERDAAAANFGTASQQYKQASDEVIALQQQATEMEAAGLSQVADEQARAPENVNRMRALDAEKRVQEDEAARLQQEQIDAGWKQYRDATIEDTRSPTEQTMAVFGVAMAGVADAILMSQGRQGNFQEGAIGQVDANIKRMVDRQLEKLDRQRENLTQSERALVNFREQVGSERAFRSFMEQKQWEDLAHIAEQVETRTKNELKHNAAAQLKASALERAAAANQQGMAAALADAQGRVREVQDLGFTMQLKQAMGAGQKKPGRSGYGLRVIDPSRPPEDAEISKAQEIASGSAGIRDTIDQLEAMAAKGSTLSPTERNIALRRVASLTAQFNGVFGDGTAPNETQMEMYKEIFTNPTEFTVTDVKREFQALREDAKSQTNSKIRFYNMALDDVDVRPE